MKVNFSKGVSIAIIGVIYAVAFGVGWLVFRAACRAEPEVWALLAADVVATLVVWGFGLLFENVSVYDPYWSVAPPVMISAWAIYKGGPGLPAELLLVAVWYWGIRLTGNWVRTFEGLAHEDWRYTRYRQTQSPAMFQLSNLFGMNLMPTLLVFACMVPGLKVIEAAAASVPQPASAGLLTWLGYAMCIAAATLQLLADSQSYRFRDAHPGEICDEGLWKRGRHPNYFGEVLMWWGVWVMYASLCGFDWLVLAPVAMTALFLFVSIPMMERRQLENKPGYADYVKRTRIFI